ncbi:MAG: Holliday junction branch migration protein RuvA [Myxococcales bacterium]|nr:Holliday junction branch migration protein RuvA [Myxococcales bacterium]
MIGFLRGKVAARDLERAWIDVHGVGYDVTMSLNGLALLPDDGSEVFVWIHTHVREDSLTLFGFVEELERNIFRHLISVSGIGPKLAIGILGSMDAARFVQNVAAGEVRSLQAIPGIGKKTAERILLDLRDKMAKIAPVPSSPTSRPPSRNERLHADLRSALLNLGYRNQHVDKALEMLEDNAETDFQKLLREALKLLA